MQYREYVNVVAQNIISRSATNSTTISGLNFATNYSIKVAAVNRAGNGVFSAPLIVTTLGIVSRK